MAININLFEGIDMRRKGQYQMLLTPQGILVMGLLVVGFLTYSFWPEGEKQYPKLQTKYDYEDFHMEHALNILEQNPNGYVDNQKFVYTRPYWFIKGNLIFFDNRKDMMFLDKAVELLDRIKARSTDTNNDGYLDFQSYYTDSHTMHIHGRLTELYADAIHIIRDNNVRKYYDKADEYEEFVDDNLIPYGLQFWRTYEKEGISFGYYETTGDGGHAIPYNQGAGITSAILRRGLDTENNDYIEIGMRYLNRFFYLNEVHEYDGLKYLAAKYYLFDPDSGEKFSEAVTDRYTDVSHLNAEFNMILLGYENNFITDEQMQLITNALNVMKMQARVGLRDTPVLNQVMGPPRKTYEDEAERGINIFYQTGLVHNLIRFGIGDQNLVYDFEEILRNQEIDGELQGDYYSDFYRCVKDPRHGYLEFCASNPITTENTAIYLAIANLGRYK